MLIGAFSLGQAAPNMESLLTAAGAAGVIFDTIDRVRTGVEAFFYQNLHCSLLLESYMCQLL